MKNKSTLKGKDSNKVYQIKNKFNCNSKMMVYLIECSVCRKQYKIATVTRLSNQACNQKCHYKHYLENNHNGICEWEITIIDHAVKEKF